MHPDVSSSIIEAVPSRGSPDVYVCDSHCTVHMLELESSKLLDRRSPKVYHHPNLCIHITHPNLAMGTHQKYYYVDISDIPLPLLGTASIIELETSGCT